MNTEDPLKVARVFVPGQIPQVTYNPRESQHLERYLLDYLDETGSILTVAGPTKTGKSVLLRRVIANPIWVDGQGINSTDMLWSMISDQLGLYSSITRTSDNTESVGAEVSSKLGLAAVAEAGGTASYDVSTTQGNQYSVERPAAATARQALEASSRPLVIDDFHFIDRTVQREIVRALKPSVLAGVAVILASVSHRVQDVVTAEPDMTGRVSALPVNFWNHDDLKFIASKGFAALNLSDPQEALAEIMAKEAFGSPHLMQKLCRELCKENNIREAQQTLTQLNAPQRWAEFFEKQVDPASKDWFQRLLAGPSTRGTQRVRWPINNEPDLSLDGYGVTMLALNETGPKLELTRDEIQRAVEATVEGASPAAQQTTRVLLHMTKIAEKRMTERQFTEDELTQLGELDSVPDVQPVLEYIEDEANSRLHIADPFFAFFIRWGGPSLLRSAKALTLAEQPDAPPRRAD